MVANAATQILLRQAPQAIDTVTTVFGLSEGERGFLLGAERGQALLSAGRHRAAFHAHAAAAEHNLITTDPAELAELDTYRGSGRWDAGAGGAGEVVVVPRQAWDRGQPVAGMPS